LAANFNSGKIDVLDRNFNLTSLGGSFVDPKLAPGFAPHGIHVIANQIYVAYAMQDAAKHDAQPGAGLGQVDIFDTNGNFISTFVAAGGKLNAPWGVVAAPSTFGTFPQRDSGGKFRGWHHKRLRQYREVSRSAHRFFEECIGESWLVGFGVRRRWSFRRSEHSLSHGRTRQPAEFPGWRQHN
jgi:hypothetical protein